MNNIFNTMARTHYLAALNHIEAKEEHKANVALNKTRDTLLAGTHSTEFSDDHARQLMVDMTAYEFMGLYGDYVRANEKTYSPWIQNDELLAKIHRHQVVLKNIITPVDIWAAQENAPRLSVA